MNYSIYLTSLTSWCSLAEFWYFQTSKAVLCRYYVYCFGGASAHVKVKPKGWFPDSWGWPIFLLPLGLPSGKRLQKTMERSTIFSWGNSLFLWWFSIVMLVYQGLCSWRKFYFTPTGRWSPIEFPVLAGSIGPVSGAQFHENFGGSDFTVVEVAYPNLWRLVP